MAKVNIKIIISILSVLLIATLSAIILMSLMAQSSKNEEDLSVSVDDDFDQTLDEARQDFFKDNPEDELDLDSVYIDDSNIIHRPPEYVEPSLDDDN